SCPMWLIDKWIGEYGLDVTRQMLSTSVGRPPVTARVNTTLITAEKLCEQLKAEGIECERAEFPEGCVKILGGSPEKTRCYKQGLFHVQDVSSQLCCMALDPKPGMTVLDVCSAPGGKSFTIAELMENKGRLLSFDLHENRVRLIRSGAERLKLDIIEESPNDAKKYKEDMPLADRVLCDVPCSGLGVIRRKPEIKYKAPGEFERLPEIQYDILSVSSRYVKEGGVLVYSTCTLSRAENDNVVDRFLKEHEDFTSCPIGGVFGDEFKASITPGKFGSDGFFIAKLMRKRK
ncbi:MAG: 16S rRNA (cytosine(967)-C(5))-methyltransferase RsmB, partial [Ruminococcus sp.]|nr:16S rRNA (cytosine(967)-C(5))-methyltransferase RsmB [Ruminococcus sp.]